MKRMLFNATYQEELRVAIVDGQALVDFDIETTTKTQLRGNIYKGVVTRVEPSLEACFVDYGVPKQGFLPFKDIDTKYLSNGNPRITEGTELIIQIDKDERGNKGAALTSLISLPGRYLVLIPNNNNSGGISRRIDGEERDELKQILNHVVIPDNMSVIVRTAALGKTPEELQWDLNYLSKLWEAITTASTGQKGSFLIYQESNLVIRSIRDHFAPDIIEILIDTESIYNQARQFISHVMPDFLDKIKLYRDDIPLFSRFLIEHQIETAYGRVVHLPSGGSIVIDRTEALTAIDVNSAKATRGSDIETTAFITNKEATEEIARQLRLRDLGGLVVIDFIDMEYQKNQRDIEHHLKQHLGIDRARIQMGNLSRFGLLELSRQRLQSSLEEATNITCPRCDGVGNIRGVESSAVHLLRIIEEDVVRGTNVLSQIQIQMPVAVATYLLNEKRDYIYKLEANMKVQIILIPNTNLETPHYKINKILVTSSDATKTPLSFNHINTDVQDIIYTSNNKQSDTSLQNKALIKNMVVPKRDPSTTTNRKTMTHVLHKLLKVLNVFAPKKSSTSSTKNKANTTSVPPVNNRNKLRPINVATSDMKIQTVRKSRVVNDKVTKNNSTEKYDNIIPNKITPKPRVNVARNKNVVKDSQPISRPRTPRVAGDTAVTKTNPTTVINKAWNNSNDIDNMISNTPREVMPSKTHHQPDLLNNIPVNVAVPVPPIKTQHLNTITEAIDLGQFTLVTTTHAPVVANTQSVEDKSVKRYTDCITNNVIKTTAPENYELVETKH